MSRESLCCLVTEYSRQSNLDNKKESRVKERCEKYAMQEETRDAIYMLRPHFSHDFYRKGRWYIYTYDTDRFSPF